MGRLTPAAVQKLLRRLDQLEGKQTEKAQTRSTTSAAVTGDLLPSENGNSEPLLSSYSRNRAVRSSPQASSPSHIPQPLIVPPSATYYSEEVVKRWLGHSWYFKGMSVFSPDGEQWLESKTGQPFTFKSLSLLKSQATTKAGRTSDHEIPNLPKKSETQELAKMYFQSRTYHTDPILDPVLFDRTIQMAYDSRANRECYKSATACIWALYALMNQQNATNAAAYATTQRFERSCLGYLDFITDESSVDHLQTLLILVFLMSIFISLLL